jgi:hypothetical protein
MTLKEDLWTLPLAVEDSLQLSLPTTDTRGPENSYSKLRQSVWKYVASWELQMARPEGPAHSAPQAMQQEPSEAVNSPQEHPETT